MSSVISERQLEQISKLNPIQHSLLRLFDQQMTEGDTAAIQQLMMAYFHQKLTEEITQIVEQKGYTTADFEQMLHNDNYVK